MRSASTGIRAAWLWKAAPCRSKRAGFTLLEALVALALVLAFAAALGPYLYQARRVSANAGSRVAAHVLLRTLLEAPFDRPSLANVSRSGEAGGLRWRIDTAPLASEATSGTGQPVWRAFRMVARVSWGADQAVTAETIRLARSK
jgi:prepilin-type N-terminal cleavage/methylation domain-containing protein